MAASVFIDTNVLLRFTLSGLNDEKKCKDQLERYFVMGTELWISGQVIREFCVQATHPDTLDRPLTGKKVVLVVESFPARFRIADATPAVRRQFLDLVGTFNLRGKQMHDAHIVATMRANGIKTLCTLNRKHFRRYQRRKLIDLEMPQGNPG